MKKSILILAMTAASVSLFAQENEATEKIKYSNITEFGIIATNPKGACLEATTIQGISINKQHLLGLGFGFGSIFYSTINTNPYDDYTYYNTTSTLCMPMFVNYRYYFKPDKPFSPHVNTAVGGLWMEDGEGVYSSITMGFRTGKFSFASGFSFMAINQEIDRGYWLNVEGPYGCYSYYQPDLKKEWRYPFGITLKVGFSF